MKFGVKNLGPIKDASIDVGDLTIICGKNNCGKSYLTYALYSFLHTAAINLALNISDDFFNSLIKDGCAVIDVTSYWPDAINDELQRTIDKFVAFIPKALAIPKSKVQPDLAFFVSLVDKDFPAFIQSKLSLSALVTEKCRILAEKAPGEPEIKFTLKNLGQRLPNKKTLREYFVGLFSFCVGQKVLDDVFAISCERTGVFLFAQELSIIAQEYIKKQGHIENNNDSNAKTVPYPLPIMKEIKFASEIKNIAKDESFLIKEYPEILRAFDDLAGGNYKVDDYMGIQFVVSNGTTNQPFSLSECSSSVKSLVELNFYLHHCARKGQILMIDEPELNLHPANQRKLARILAMLVNAGIKIFITTHSDYIIREFNNLIQLANNDAFIQKVRKDEHYSEKELLEAAKVKAYIAKWEEDGVHVSSAQVTSADGITIDTLNEVIDDMRQLHDEIVWGE